MKLHELGFNDWFQKKISDIQLTEHNVARVVAVNKGNYIIINERGEVLAEIIGKIRFKA